MTREEEDKAAASQLASAIFDCIDWQRQRFDFDKAERQIVYAFEAARLDCHPKEKK